MTDFLIRSNSNSKRGQKKSKKTSSLGLEFDWGTTVRAAPTASSLWSRCYNPQPHCIERFQETNDNPRFIIAIRLNPPGQGRAFPSFAIDPSKSTPTPLTQRLRPLLREIPDSITIQVAKASACGFRA